MVSRETRVYLTGFALTVAFVLAYAFLPALVSGFWIEGPLAILAILLTFPILPFLLPQLYLAAIGDETENVPPRTRIRVSLFISGLIPLWLYTTMESDQSGRWVAGGFAAVLLGSLLLHELLLGYRQSSLFEDSNAE